MRICKSVMTEEEITIGYICEICNNKVYAEFPSYFKRGINPNPLWEMVEISADTMHLIDNDANLEYGVKSRIHVDVCSAKCYLKTIKKYYDLYKDDPSLEIDDKSITFIEDLLQTLGDKIK